MTTGCEGDETQADALGERLAVWLEELELTEHLKAAGLPRVERDHDGVARWSDPFTGDALTLQQIQELDAVLRSQGSDPEYAVPLSLLQIARRARVREELLASAWFTYETLGDVRGASVDATRFSVHKASEQHRLLIVDVGGQVIVPGFQLDERGEVRPELLALLYPLLSAGMDLWRAWAWLTQPVALLSGEIPIEVASDPPRRDFARQAALSLAERVKDR